MTDLRLFDTPGPRLFGLPPGSDFPADLLAGLEARLGDAPPHQRARVQIIVNTQRMRRRIRRIFDTGPAGLLPRVDLLTDLDCRAPIPPSVSAIRRRLELIRLISALLDAEPDLAPRAALYDLADSLARLLDEMQGERVTLEDIAALDVSDLSGHWARAQRFLEIVGQVPRADDLPDPEERQRRVVETLIAEWDAAPPQHPVILAGSTGSRGATHLLMQAVARLPQGAVLLPGFDFDLPQAIWEQLDDPLTGEDHPQFRFRKLMLGLGLEPSDVRPWAEAACHPARNRLVSLAMRPAPVTHQWLEEGPGLGALEPPLEGVTLIKAPGPRAEAMAIALRLRHAAESGEVAALITPDRSLTRQVSAALTRWGILPDDSAGTPLQTTPPGRLLRQVADLFDAPPTAVKMLALLKHPLTHTGQDRGPHLELTRRLELYLRREARPHPGPEDIRAFVERQHLPLAEPWADWLCQWAFTTAEPGPVALETRVAQHRALAETLSRGTAPEGTGALWDKDEGTAALRVMEKLAQDAPHGDVFTARDYGDLASAILGTEEVRNPDEPHPRVLIWGTLEARVQGADVVILGGLNEGSWPEATQPDPWLNRQMRKDAGLLLPERKIGLSAHDFQQAVAAKEVWLTRALRNQDAETVPSRWLNRLTNLLSGLPGQGGPGALAAMEARGAHWLGLVRGVEAPVSAPRAPRPSPAPPVAARPRELWVTDIRTLIRDPYAIYAKRILRLRRLNPLMRDPDAMMRGIVSHTAIETFVQGVNEGRISLTRAALLSTVSEVLDRDVPWGEARALWRARLDRNADWFLRGEEARQAEALQVFTEKTGKAEIRELGFTLSAKADRVDLDTHGRVHLFDYKTGTPPSEAQQKTFDKQLLLEAAIAERAGFGDLGPRPVAQAVYIGLGTNPKEVPAPLGDEPPGTVWENFTELARAWLEPERGYTARRAMEEMNRAGDYDQLSRHGEWEDSDAPDLRPLSMEFGHEA
ncbi:double-strand break repair protein AddB [Pseudooceanicola antarcticus]|uniref:Double-strand break repair protein AddB n=1 Tax=Pseudooceanicola antarcticus TaxID=1247613 RepID=A0A285HTM4_9RHOB|nr:double-strand break repair protein AddB [Pseudooceanicola antarcticus]PJE27541.1 double-strand break repair protein AddB [Pseudooceanicola antarcticus]SNY39060.1 double-strand break repair protein AddB [Pseudooceanicola antarcticus]